MANVNRPKKPDPRKEILRVLPALTGAEAQLTQSVTTKASPRQAAQRRNHPQKGSTTTVEPIRDKKDIKLIRLLLADKPRDLVLFTVGINTNLRASDLLRITVGQVRYLSPGDHFTMREMKTGKLREVTISGPVLDIIKKLLATMPEARDNDLLFQSRVKSTRQEVVKELKRKGTVVRQPLAGEITVPHLNRMVKSWCNAAKVRGNFGAHTLRKTFGFMQRTEFHVPTSILMECFNHSSEKQTLRYLGIQREEVRNVFLNAI